MTALVKIRRKTSIAVLFTFLAIAISSCKGSDDANDNKDDNTLEPIALTKTIPTGGNSWVVGDLDKNKNILGTGVHNWVNLNDKVRTYFYANTIGEIGVGLTIKTAIGLSKIKVTIGDNSKEVEVNNTEYKDIYVGAFNIKNKGYNYVELQGIAKEGAYIADLKSIKLGGTAATDITYIENKENFYFGRRGPSVHLGYTPPTGKDVTWFYNEVNVPKDNDVEGSYYMANGFSTGYFGMQVNSKTERRILFSVWSAFDTQDPNQIPNDYKVLPLGNGAGVTVGEFGNEGSGAQSYMIFDWKPETTYKFLLKGESIVDGAIDYTAYFFAPEEGNWQLIASFRRPKTTEKHITQPYSFLENFIPSGGHIERKVDFKNQWAYDTTGNWTEMIEARYTADATARDKHRFDYDGGANGSSFYLRNCGFFSDNTKFDTTVSRTANGVEPVIDFSSLETPTPPSK